MAKKDALEKQKVHNSQNRKVIFKRAEKYAEEYAEQVHFAIQVSFCLVSQSSEIESVDRIVAGSHSSDF